MSGWWGRGERGTGVVHRLVLPGGRNLVGEFVECGGKEGG